MHYIQYEEQSCCQSGRVHGQSDVRIFQVYLYGYAHPQLYGQSVNKHKINCYLYYLYSIENTDSSS